LAIRLFRLRASLAGAFFVFRGSQNLIFSTHRSVSSFISPEQLRQWLRWPFVAEPPDAVVVALMANRCFTAESDGGPGRIRVDIGVSWSSVVGAG